MDVLLQPIKKQLGQERSFHMLGWMGRHEFQANDQPYDCFFFWTVVSQSYWYKWCHDQRCEVSSRYFFEAIEHIGETNLIQIITHNATNYKAAGAPEEEKNPHIFWTPSVVQYLNLAVKAICEPFKKSSQFSECEWILKLVKQVNDINNFFISHNLSKSIFNHYSNVELLKVAETRLASKIVMANRLRWVKDELEKRVMDPDWKNFKVNGRAPVELIGWEVKDLIVSDTF